MVLLLRPGPASCAGRTPTDYCAAAHIVSTSGNEHGRRSLRPEYGRFSQRGRWSCSGRSSSTGSAIRCWSGRWRGSMTCTAAWFGRRSRRRCRPIVRSRSGRRRSGRIDEMLREDLAAPRKRRHTARRVFERLADEHDAQVSYPYVAKYVAQQTARPVRQLT